MTFVPLLSESRCGFDPGSVGMLVTGLTHASRTLIFSFKREEVRVAHGCVTRRTDAPRREEGLARISHRLTPYFAGAK